VAAQLVAEVERRAGESGARELALDTAMPAVELIAYYEKLGFRRVAQTQWPGKTYRTEIMSKSLRPLQQDKSAAR